MILAAFLSLLCMLIIALAAGYAVEGEPAFKSVKTSIKVLLLTMSLCLLVLCVQRINDYNQTAPDSIVGIH